MFGRIRRSRKEWFLDINEVEETYRDEFEAVSEMEDKVEAAKALAQVQYKHWSRIGRLLELARKDGYEFSYNKGTGYWHGTSLS